MKRFVMAAIFALALSSAAVSAQTTTTCNGSEKCKTEKAECKKDGNKCDKAGKKCDKAYKDCKRAGKECAKAGKKCDKAGKACVKAGSDSCMNAGKQCVKAGKPCKTGKTRLSAAELSNIEFDGIQLTDAQKAKLDVVKENRKAKMEAFKQNRKEGEARVNMDSLKKANKKEYLYEVKEILSPDQYVVYLENIVVNANPGKPASGKMKAHAAERRAEKAAPAAVVTK